MYYYCTKKTNTIPMHTTNINEAMIRYWYFMFLSVTNVKISNKDFNWKKKKKEEKKSKWIIVQIMCLIKIALIKSDWFSSSTYSYNNCIL